MTRRQILTLIALFLVTRAALVAVGVVAVTRLPVTEGAEFTHLLDDVPALDMWYRWDAGFYASIATYGYDWQTERRPTDDMAFFPLYPLAVRAVMPLVAPFSPYLSTQATLAGLIVSNLALLVGAFALFDLARRHATTGTAWRAVLLLFLSPGSIFLSGVYTEGLFFALCVLTFWWLSRERFALAALTAGLAALTRSVGVALVPALLWWLWERRYPTPLPRPQSVREREQASPAAPLSALSGLPLVASREGEQTHNAVSFSPSPWQWRGGRGVSLLALLPAALFAAYIAITGWAAGEPLAYFQAYTGTWGRARGTPLDAFTLYFSGEPVSLFGWHPAWIDLAATLGYLALAVVVLRQKVTWGLFALFALLIPIATGSLLSMPRFGTVIFPFYIVLGAWADKRWKQAFVVAVSLALWLLFTTQFVRWRWIA